MKNNSYFLKGFNLARQRISYMLSKFSEFEVSFVGGTKRCKASFFGGGGGLCIICQVSRVRRPILSTCCPHSKNQKNKRFASEICVARYTTHVCKTAQANT